MTNSEERTRRIWSKVGMVFLVVAAVTVVIGLLSMLLLDEGGARIVAGGFHYALAGLVFRPSTWERVSYPFYPQRTPMMGILIVVFTTMALWEVVVNILF